MATKKTTKTKTKTKAKAKTKKPAAKSAARSSVAAKTKAKSKTVTKTTKKTAAKKTAAKKTATKKTTAKSAKTTTKKAAAKPKTAAKAKTATKKTAAKKPVAPKKMAQPKPKTSAAKKEAAAKAEAKAAEKKAEAKKLAEKKAADVAESKARAATAKTDFKKKDHIVYPAHGVGQILEIEEREVAGIKLELFVIQFDKDKMTLRVPTAKARAVGMRKLAGPDVIQNALKTLKGRARIKRTMWSRRAQEYEAKINSGDLISIAEVVRDLHRGDGQPEQSYSERQLYEAALDRMARELAAAESIDEDAAVERLEQVLHKDAA